MTTKQAEWEEYTGSEEQIGSMRSGFIFRDVNGEQCNLIKRACDFESDEHLRNYLANCECVEIWICNPHPYYDKELQQWSMTQQPAWWSMLKNHAID